MQRVDDAPVRENWHETVIQQGLVYVNTDVPNPDNPVGYDRRYYWREGKFYLLDDSETEIIGKAGVALYQAFIDVCEMILAFERAAHDDPFHREEDCYFRKLAIPEKAIGPIMRTWQLNNIDNSENTVPEHYPTLYGRFDLCPILDEDGKVIGVKLLEFNADTPTSVLETADIQWQWYEALAEQLTQRFGEIDQWNELYEQLVVAWKEEIRKYERTTGNRVSVVHVAFTDAEEEGEDAFTVGVIGSAAEDAARMLSRDGQTPAFKVEYITMESIRRIPASDDTTTIVVGAMNPDGTFNTADQGAIPGHFVDGSGQRIEVIFKLHPWEHFFNPTHTKYGFGETAMHDMMSAKPTIWIEPIYKMLWSNKAILAILWEQCKDKPEIAQYLLPAYLPNDPAMPADFGQNAARKPLLGREGANVMLVQDGSVLENCGGIYGSEGYMLQELCLLPTFQDRHEGAMHPVIGLWMVRDSDAGMCIRESDGLVTGNTSYFVPHLVRKGH